MARRNLYNEQNQEHKASVFGGIATLVTGSGAGAAGVGKEKTLSGIAGGLSLLSGILTLVLTNPSSQEVLTAEQNRVSQAWSDSRIKLAEFENALVVLLAAAEPEKPAAQQAVTRAFQAMNTSLTACGVAPIDVKALQAVFLELQLNPS